MLASALRHAFTIPAALALLAAASPTSLRAAPAVESNAVVVQNFAFSPAALTVKAGATVTWKNLDDEPHTIVGPAGAFRSSALDQGDAFQFKFDKPGTYAYWCSIHPRMKATIIVR